MTRKMVVERKFMLEVDFRDELKRWL